MLFHIKVTVRETRGNGLSNYPRYLLSHNHDIKSNLEPLHLKNVINSFEEFKIYRAPTNINNGNFLFNEQLHFKSSPLCVLP